MNGDSAGTSSSSAVAGYSSPSQKNGEPAAYPQLTDFKGANEGIQVRKVNDLVGQGVFATRKFEKGEQVLADMPIVTCQFAWNQNYKYRACDYCMRALETAEENVRRLTQVPTFELPFPECCETRRDLEVKCEGCPATYCSPQCRTKAFNEHHKILCYQSENPPENVKKLDEYWRSMHYPPETANIMLLVRLLVRLHLDTDGSLTGRIENFCQSSTNEDEELAHKVLGDEYVLQISTLRELITRIFPDNKTFSNIQKWLTPEGFLKLWVICGRNSQGVGTSAFATYVSNVEKLGNISEDQKKAVLDTVDHIYEVMDSVVGHFMDNEGVALYPLQSWVNHSCVPNCEVKFPDKNHRVGLIATRDIEEGEEIKISYLDLSDLSRSRYSRNKYLKEHYLFECDCPKCVEQINDEACTSDSDEYMTEEEEEDEMCV